MSKKALFMDVESYPNFLHVSFSDGAGASWHTNTTEGWKAAQVRRLLTSYEICTFNGAGYDLPLLEIILRSAGDGPTLAKIAWRVTVRLIAAREHPRSVLESYGITWRDRLPVDHVDLKGASFGKASLKTYGGRIGTSWMRDLPYEPGKVLSSAEQAVTASYCENDLAVTAGLRVALSDALTLREEMGATYGLDLRSKSDPQLAEAIMRSEIERATGERIPRMDPERYVGKRFGYNGAPYLQFRSAELRDLYRYVREHEYLVLSTGKIQMPERLKTPISLAGVAYKVGLGGLHSQESRVTHKSDERYTFEDRDVASYYPSMILSVGLYPEHIGPVFLDVYKTRIVDRRLAAKADPARAGEAAGLKIAANGIFGKFSEKFSSVYAPHLMIATTLTGQMSLLMLIERITDAGFQVVSANTDGIVTKVDERRRGVYESVCDQWCADTKLVLEATPYEAIYARDVSNYVAVVDSAAGKVKRKGEFRQVDSYPHLSKNPSGEVIYDAVTDALIGRSSPGEHVDACQDPLKFAFVRKVEGGAALDGEEVGKVIRYAYGTKRYSPMRYKSNGNLVPDTYGALPMMNLAEFDFAQVDRNRYAAQAMKILARDFGSPADRQRSLL